MFVYRYRLRDYYEHPIASIAILLDDDPNWRPCNYIENLWDSEISMRFPIIKLIDYNARTQELEESTNPFAIIILAQLIALKKQNLELKLANKLQITKKLYTLGFNKKEVLALFKFIDWIITLPKESEIEYMRNVARLEKEELGKNFICPAEQLWIDQGIEQVARNMLNKGMSARDVVKFTGLSITIVKKLKTKRQ